MRHILSGSTIGRSVSWSAAMVLLASLALTAPQTAFAQKIPDPGPPVMVGFPCPGCGQFVRTPNGKMPSACPYCRFSFVQQPKPAPKAPATPGKPQLQTIDPFGDYLFYDVPINPEDGKLQTRHFDPDGLPARAEEWSKQMRQMDEQARQKQQSQAQDFERNKQDILKSIDASRSNGSAMQQLKNVYADDKAWDTGTKSGGKTPGGDPNVVDLSGVSNPTVQSLKGSDPGLSLKVNPPPPPAVEGAPTTSLLKTAADTLINWDALQAKSDITKVMTPYEADKVDKIRAEGGWVIVARDLADPTAAGLTNWKVGEDNPYGKHWQMLLPGGENVGYFGETKGADGAVRVSIGADKNTVPAYTGTIAAGKDGAVMAEAVKNVQTRWEQKFAADPDANRYNLYSHNCQSFTGELLQEYNRLLAARKQAATSPMDAH